METLGADAYRKNFEAWADYWVRVTAGCRKTNGQWMLIHEHVSMPFANREFMQAVAQRPR